MNFIFAYALTGLGNSTSTYASVGSPHLLTGCFKRLSVGLGHSPSVCASVSFPHLMTGGSERLPDDMGNLRPVPQTPPVATCVISHPGERMICSRNQTINRSRLTAATGFKDYYSRYICRNTATYYLIILNFLLQSDIRTKSDICLTDIFYHVIIMFKLYSFTSIYIEIMQRRVLPPNVPND